MYSNMCFLAQRNSGWWDQRSSYIAIAIQSLASFAWAFDWVYATWYRFSFAETQAPLISKCSESYLSQNQSSSCVLMILWRVQRKIFQHSCQVTSNGGSEAIRAQRIDARHKSEPVVTSHWFLGLQMAHKCYPRSTWILQSKATMLVVTMTREVYQSIRYKCMWESTSNSLLSTEKILSFTSHRK